MGSIKTSGKKKRLVTARKQTRWAPFWIIPKIFGLNRARKVHPSRLTKIKRNWRRSKLKA